MHNKGVERTTEKMHEVKLTTKKSIPSGSSLNSKAMGPSQWVHLAKLRPGVEGCRQRLQIPVSMAMTSERRRRLRKIGISWDGATNNFQVFRLETTLHTNDTI